MIYYIGGNYSDELYHYGVKGMHWGIRRYQNYDGTRIGAGEKAATRVTPGMKSGRTFKSTVVGGQGGKATGTARLAAANIPEKMGRSSGSDSSNASSDADKTSTGEKVFGPSYKRGKGKENSSVAQETANHVLELNKANRDIIKNFKDADPKVKAEREKQERSLAKEAKKMSDKELRDSINRIKMEREYVSLNSKETETGYDKALDILNKAEPFIKVAAEVAGLILLLYKIKGMGHSAMDDSVADVFVYCVENGFDGDIIEHAANLDFDYILDYYDIDEDKLQHILDCEDELYHHGIKGQKWGIRRFQNPDGTRIGTAKQKPGEQRFAKQFGNSVAGGQGGKATGTARLAANAGGLFGSTTKNTNSEDVRESRKKTRKYFEMLDADMDGIKRSRSPQKKQQLESQRQSLQNEYDHLSYRKASKEVLDIAKKWNLDGDIFSKRNEKDFSREEKNASRDAKKDAEEFARAKAFYGEGAGNRRKAIKTTVDAKSKKDDFYALEFEYHLSQQDMEEHMRQAKMERSQRDTATNTRKAINKTNRALGQISRWL